MKNWHLRESATIPGLIHGVEDGFGCTIKLNGFALSCSPEASQNTRDVVKAVRLHDDLVAALRDMVDAYAESGVEAEDQPSMVREAMAVLARLEPK